MAFVVYPYAQADRTNALLVILTGTAIRSSAGAGSVHFWVFGTSCFAPEWLPKNFTKQIYFHHRRLPE